jgi:hypothetical protein
MTSRGKREAALEVELHSLLDDPRAVEVLLNNWLHDASLKIPSFDLIQYLGFRLLTGPGMLLIASHGTREEIAGAIVDGLREEPADDRKASIKRVLDALDSYRFLHSGKKGSYNPFTHEWLGILAPYLDSEGPAGTEHDSRYSAGRRALARGLIEAMIHRTLFFGDFKRMEALAEAQRLLTGARELVPVHENRIASEILRCLPFIVDALGRKPTKTEIKEMLRHAWPEELPDHPSHWTKAFKIVGYPADRDKKAKADMSRVLRIARMLAAY